MGRPRKYTLNENYFEKIDTNNKAYVLGFLYADGSIYRNYLTIGIANKDIEIINLIRNELNYNGPYKIRVSNGNDYVVLSISSKKITNDLINLGVISNKTYKSKTLPIVPNEFFWDMIRGFFDGDGSIYQCKKNNKIVEYGVCFSSNIFVLDQLKTILYNNNISSSKIRLRQKNSENSGMLEIKGAINLEKLYNLLYDKNSIFLERKHKKFLMFFEFLKNMTKRNLTEETITIIKKHYLSGMTQKEIHIKENIPFSTVRGVIQRLRKLNLVT